MRKTPILTGMATAAGLVAALGVVVAPAAGLREEDRAAGAPGEAAAARPA